MASLLDYLEAHPVLMTCVVWPIVTAALSFLLGLVEKRFPLAVGAMRAAGLDLAGLLRLIGAALSRRGIAPPPDDAKPTLPTVPPLLVLVLSCLALIGLGGCAQARELEAMVQKSSVVVARSEPCLVAQYEAEQMACLHEVDLTKAEACVKRVRADWAPLERDLADLRAARCLVEPAKCEAAK